MIDLFSTTQVLLKDAGYEVRLSEIQKQPLVSFEDNGIVGFCSFFQDPADIVSNWLTHESEILARFAPNFRSAGDKAWNVYCIYLCGAAPSQIDARKISWIEEDLNRTRKIAAGGITSRDELARVLLPVLPLQYQPRLPEGDATRRLEKRIGEIAPKAQEAALDPEISPHEVIRLLGERA